VLRRPALRPNPLASLGGRASAQAHLRTVAVPRTRAVVVSPVPGGEGGAGSGRAGVQEKVVPVLFEVRVAPVIVLPVKVEPSASLIWAATPVPLSIVLPAKYRFVGRPEGVE